MRDAAVPGKAERTADWPGSPAMLFGIAAAFFAVMGIVLLSTGVLHDRLPFVQNGQVIHVRAGNLVFLVGVPFALFALIYRGIELGTSRVFQKSISRLHFVCTWFAVLEAIRVYTAWAIRTGNPASGGMTRSSFGGTFAFLLLAGGLFAWNVCTSTKKPGAAR